MLKRNYEVPNLHNGNRTWQHEGRRVEQTLEFAVRHQGAGEGDASDVGAEEDGALDHGGGRVGGEGGEVVDVGGHAGENGGHADEGVEGGDELGQVGDLDFLGDGGADEGAATRRHAHLGEHRLRGQQDAEGGGDAAADADHAQGVAEARRRLRGEAAEGPHAAERGGEVGHLVDLLVAVGDGPAVGAEEGGAGEAVQVVVLGRVGRPLEHVEHPRGDDEAPEHVDERDEGGGGGHSLDGVGRVVAAAH